MGRDHSCEGCGRGGFNDPDGKCICPNQEAVEAGWAYVEANAEGPWSRTTFAAALEAARPIIEKEVRERLRDHAAMKDEWARDPEASWDAAERTVLAREAQAIRSALAALDKEAEDE